MRVSRFLSFLTLLTISVGSIASSASAAPQVQIVAGGGPSNASREGAIVLSTDNGVSWREVWYSDAPNARINRIRYFAEPGRYVAAGNFGVLYSTDGENWTMSNAENGGYRTMNDVAYGNGTFVAVGPRGGVMYSHDGEHWKHLFYRDIGRLNLPAMKDWEQKINTRVSDANFRGVAFAGGVFVATGTYERALAFTILFNGEAMVVRDTRNALSSINKSIGIISDNDQNVLIYGSRRHWMSNDAGKTFRRVRELKDVVTLDAVLIGDQFFLGADRSILLTAKTDGTVWIRSKLKGYNFFTFSLGQVNGNLIAVPRTGLIRFSLDKGETWVQSKVSLKSPEGYRMDMETVTGRVQP